MLQLKSMLHTWRLVSGTMGIDFCIEGIFVNLYMYFGVSVILQIDDHKHSIQSKESYCGDFIYNMMHSENFYFSTLIFSFLCQYQFETPTFLNYSCVNWRTPGSLKIIFWYWLLWYNPQWWHVGQLVLRILKHQDSNVHLKLSQIKPSIIQTIITYTKI